MKNTKLKRFKQSQEKKNRKNVLDTLNILKEATPSKIFEFIDLKSEEEAKDYFKENNISFTSEKFEKKKKEFSMVIRTVKSILEKLTNEHLVIHKKGGIYSLNESLNNFLFFPNDFGKSMVYSIGSFFPSTIEKSLEEFVNRYGLFMIFAFLQLLYYNNSKEDRNENILKGEKEETNNYWLEDAIPLKFMFNLFTKLYFNNKENTKIINLKIIKGLNKLIENKYPLYYKEFNNNIKKNQELKHKNNQQRKKFDEAFDKLEDFFEIELKKEKLIHKYESKPYELSTIFGNKVSARMAPKDWWDQLAKLAKESE